jgi:alpha-galactosidase
LINIVQNNYEIVEVHNGIIGFKFYKNGQNRGKYSIFFDLEKENNCSLKECYSSLNFYKVGVNNLIEVSSTKNIFNSKIEKIEDSLGIGMKIIFESKKELSFKIQFKIYDKKQFILIRLIKINDKTENPLAVHSLAPLTIKNSKLWLTGNENPTNLNNITWFKNGFQSWSPCRIIFGNEQDNKGPSQEIFNLMYDNQDYKIEGRFYSEYCTAITDLDSMNTLILGFVSFKDQFTRIILDYENSEDLKLLTALGCMDGVKLNESSIRSSEELFVCVKTNNQGYKGLIDYAKTVKSFTKEKRITTIPIGWCSWYYYYTKITQEDLLKNLEFFTENREILPIDFIQLDDGYFTEIGDFNVINAKFSNGLWWLFKKIKQSGFKGGIWTAPFFAVKKSTLFKNHRSWFLTRSDKLLRTCLNWGASEYSLDLTNEEVLNYLKDFFSKLVFAFKENHNGSINHDIQFHKIDFLHAAVPFNADYKDRTLTRAQLYCNGVKVIREAITDNAFLLGCGAPLGPCVGLVDAMRISYDTAPHWESNYFEKYEIGGGIAQPSLKIALINILYRSFMHKYFWINDPDCLMIRQTDTNLTNDEIKLQITIFGLSGGQILISDDMTRLTNNEINDAKLVIPPYNPNEYDPIVIDAFTSVLPSIYMLETKENIGKRFLTAIINWEDNSISRELKISEIIPNHSNELKKLYVYDFWDNEFLGEYNIDDTLKLENINPHSCKYITLIPVNGELNNFPVLLSTNLHITQGCCEIKSYKYKIESNELFIEIELRGIREGFLILKLPKNKKIEKHQFDISTIDSVNNIWKLFVKFEDRTSLKIKII